jgi:hypothetical protein
MKPTLRQLLQLLIQIYVELSNCMLLRKRVE